MTAVTFDSKARRVAGTGKVSRCVPENWTGGYVVAAQICGLKVGPVAVLGRAVDRSGDPATVCVSPQIAWALRPDQEGTPAPLEGAE